MSSKNVEELIDLEEHAKRGHKPPRARRYRIRIDREYYIVDVPKMTGRQLLLLAGKNPPERYEIMQKFHGRQDRARSASTKTLTSRPPESRIRHASS